MRWPSLSAAAVLLLLTASGISAQHATPRLAVRAVVVRSCTVQTGNSSVTPPQVNCSRGAGPAPHTTISIAATPSVASDLAVNPGAPVPVSETRTRTAVVEPVRAATTLAEVTASTEWPIEPAAEQPSAPPTGYQIVTINF
jgi:hypothetical protein